MEQKQQSDISSNSVQEKENNNHSGNILEINKIGDTGLAIVTVDDEPHQNSFISLGNTKLIHNTSYDVCHSMIENKEWELITLVIMAVVDIINQQKQN